MDIHRLSVDAYATSIPGKKVHRHLVCAKGAAPLHAASTIRVFLFVFPPAFLYLHPTPLPFYHSQTTGQP
jgi:hypothetical protein